MITGTNVAVSFRCEEREFEDLEEKDSTIFPLDNDKNPGLCLPRWIVNGTDVVSINTRPPISSI